MKTLRLYHYTNRNALPAIVASAALKLTESNVSTRRMNAGPPVIWFTTKADPSGGHGLKPHEWATQLSDFDNWDKARIRITVEVVRSSVTRYVDFAKSHGVSERTLALMAAQGGLYSWWVSTRAIFMDDWVEIRDLKDTAEDPRGRMLWYRRGQQQSTELNFRQVLEKFGRPVSEENQARIEVLKDRRKKKSKR